MNTTTEEVEPDAFDRKGPSARFDGALTASDVDARYKELHRQVCAEYGVTSDHFWSAYGDDGTPGAVPGFKKAMQALGEDYRLAHCRAAGKLGRRSAGTGARRPQERAIPLVMPPEDAPRGWPMVCVACGEEKPSSKFPTVTGKPGAREARCRACRDAAKRSSN